MKKKFIFKILLCLIIVSLFITNSYALEIDNLSNEYYQETGNIILNNLDLEVINNKLVYEESLNSEQYSELTKELSNNYELEDFIVDLLNNDEFNDKTIAAIGYTKVYLKEIESSEGLHLEPITTADFRNNTDLASTSKPGSKGSLTLSTVIAIDNFDTSIATCYSYADWKYSLTGNVQDQPEKSNDDYMTASHPKNFYLNNDSISGICTNSYRLDKEYTTVVYGFKTQEKKGRITLTTGSKKQSNASGVKEWVSKYVHTWKAITPSFSIGTTGVSIGGVSSDKSWQIASYATY